MAGGPTNLWQDLGNLTAVQTQPAVGARDYATMVALSDAKTIQFEIPELVDNVDFRFECKADADAYVIELWVAAGATMRDSTVEEQFALGAVLTLTGGTQEATESNFFIDTIVETTAGVLAGTLHDATGGSNRQATWSVNLRGYRYGIIIATTYEGSTTFHAHARY